MLSPLPQRASLTEGWCPQCPSARIVPIAHPGENVPAINDLKLHRRLGGRGSKVKPARGYKRRSPTVTAQHQNMCVGKADCIFPWRQRLFAGNECKRNVELCDLAGLSLCYGNQRSG